MAQLYRLRSMARLFGESQELEKQTIYFASAEKLNDPMEGFRDIFWQGDRIAVLYARGAISRRDFPHVLRTETRQLRLPYARRAVRDG